MRKAIQDDQWSLNPIPFLTPLTCCEQGFVHFGIWPTHIPEPYCVYKDARYLVIQLDVFADQGTIGRPEVARQLVIPRAALSWLAYRVRHPFTQREGYEGVFDGEVLRVHRNATHAGEGVTGFVIQNLSRTLGKRQPQQLLISDDFMHEYLVPLMDALNCGS
ncbi:MAG: hypothetical protein U1F46_12680 [Marinagarivorans sp.]